MSTLSLNGAETQFTELHSTQAVQSQFRKEQAKGPAHFCFLCVVRGFLTVILTHGATPARAGLYLFKFDHSFMYSFIYQFINQIIVETMSCARHFRLQMVKTGVVLRERLWQSRQWASPSYTWLLCFHTGESPIEWKGDLNFSKLLMLCQGSLAWTLEFLGSRFTEFF